MTISTNLTYYHSIVMTI